MDGDTLSRVSDGEGSEGSAAAVGDGSATAARGRVDDIRRVLAGTTDERVRSRMRVRLVDLLSALGDAPGALGELRQAAAEGPPSSGLLFALGVAAAPRLAPDQVEEMRAAMEARRPTVGSVVSPRGRGRATAAKNAVKSASAPVAAASVVTTLPIPAPWAPAAAESASRGDLLEQAFASLAQGKPIRARRLAEDAVRLSGADPGAVGDPVGAPPDDQLRELVAGLRAASASRQALVLARSLIETDDHASALPAPKAAALAALVAEATELGEADLAARWGTDLGIAAEPPASRQSVRDASSAKKRESPRGRVAPRAALFAAIEASTGDLSSPPRATALPLPMPARAGGRRERSGHGATDVVPTTFVAAATRADLYQQAFDAERMPRPRARLALRWSEALRAAGDDQAAVVVLGRAIEELPVDVSRPLRSARADLLRGVGREADLAAALDGDAQLARGEERVKLRAEQARLLDHLGDFDLALEVRLSALAESPGHLELLAPARQRLETVGRLDRSLELATAAIPYVGDRGARAGLLRDVATLAEATAGDRERAALAWLEVLALHPSDATAFEAAERLLRQLDDGPRLGALLAWSASRESEPAPRARALWRLAEFRREQAAEPARALPLYRELLRGAAAQGDGAAADGGGGGGGGVGGMALKEEDWQRRDDLLAVHSARALAAPDAASWASAIAARADSLMAAGRSEDADRELGRALELAPEVPEVIAALERLYARRGDPRGLRKRLLAAVERSTGNVTAGLWVGIGRINEKLGDVPAARAAYERAAAEDGASREPLLMLRQLAAAAADWAQVAGLLEREIALNPTLSERVGLLVEGGALFATKLGDPERAVEMLDAALVLEPANTTALDAMFGAALAVGVWEKAMQALEAMLGAGLALADTSQRYYRVAVAAEKAGQVDRALGLYSRSYARNPVFRPTLERLSEICFEKQQWENAWKATEHLIQRHGADFDISTRAELALRSALADLHVAQRLVASNRIAAMMSGPTAQTGVRDVADSWASMRFERRLLTGLDGDRRARVLSRLGEVLTLTNDNPTHTARAVARETLAALAVVERRWADALVLLEAFAADVALEPRSRCLFLVTAGDILLHQQGDVPGAALQYQRARLLNPHEPRLARPGIMQMGGGSATLPTAARPLSPAVSERGETARPAAIAPLKTTVVSAGDPPDHDHRGEGKVDVSATTPAPQARPKRPGGPPERQ